MFNLPHDLLPLSQMPAEYMAVSWVDHDGHRVIWTCLGENESRFAKFWKSLWLEWLCVGGGELFYTFWQLTWAH